MKISCLNPIAAVGMQLFTDAYEKVDDFAASDAALTFLFAVMRMPVLPSPPLQ